MSDAELSPEERLRRRRRVRRVVWVLVVVVLLVALVVTPPLLNVGRLRKRIAASMSESLGRPVHLDSVTLNVLPVPGFTLENLVVSEDPAFGAEPVIRADSVRATIRVSSLWRRRVEFATIRFDAPSVNLVRRADGRWNIETILLHAAQEETAPTAQMKAGPAPRFPYIEATGARLNVKLGDEKMPLALTDADFALWLPSPQEWRVRVEAKPARTDTNVSDSGVLTVEGTLQKAARVEDVPIEMTAAWRQAPLGEATRLLMGSDMGWRGSVEAAAHLHGTLGDAVLTGNLKLGSLRRADFIPAKTLDVNTECAAHLSVAVAVVKEPMCTVSPTPIRHLGFGSVEETPASAVYATADRVELTGLKVTGGKVGTPGVSLAWLMDFARLWSRRIPVEESPEGMAKGSFKRVGDGWQGELGGTIRVASLDDDGGKAADREFAVTAAGKEFALAPFDVTYEAKTALMLSGTADAASLTVRLVGSGTAKQVGFLGWAMPPLADGMGDATAGKIDVTCTRAWGGEQTCVAVRPTEAVKPKRRR